MTVFAVSALKLVLVNGLGVAAITASGDRRERDLFLAHPLWVAPKAGLLGVTSLKVKACDCVIKMSFTPASWGVTLSACTVAKTISMNILLAMALSTLHRARLVFSLWVTALTLCDPMFTDEREATLSIMVENQLLETLLTVTRGAR